MIHDDDVALLCSAPHFSDKAPLPLAALLPDASLGARVQLVPEEAGFGEFRQFRPVARRGRLFPCGDGAILFNLVQAAEDRLVGQIVEFLAAQIIVAAFHITNREPGPGCGISVQRLLQEGYVLVEKLFL